MREGKTLRDLATRIETARPITAVGLIMGTLALSYVIVFNAGGTSYLAPHFFFVPILVAALRFGLAGTLPTVLLASIAAGPLLPADVGAGFEQHLGDWFSRGVSFLALGTLMAMGATQLQRSRDEQLALAYRERQLAQRSATIIQSVSHEFRTPLTVIAGTSRMLQNSSLVDPRGQDLLGGLDRATRRLEQLVALVLAAAEKGPATGDRPIRFGVLAADVTAGLAHRGAHDRVAVHDQTLMLVTVVDVLHTLLHAIVDNALKFSPPDTPVDLRARHETGILHIEVRDHGPGVDPGDIERLFDPFQQLDGSDTREQGGLGMGLFAARRLARRLGGEVALGPADGGGTRVHITLPHRRTTDSHGLPRDTGSPDRGAGHAEHTT